MNFTCVPTLSRHLYYVPKYKYINSYREEDINKVISLGITNIDISFKVISDFKLFYTQTDERTGNRFITSNFILTGKYKNKEIYIKENTYFDSFNKNDTIMLKYDLCLKLDNNIASNISCLEYFNSGVNFTDNLWNLMSENNYGIVKNIDKLIYNNIEYAYSGEQLIDHLYCEPV